MKKKEANGEDRHENGNEGEQAEDANAFAAKFGEAQGLGIDLRIRHGIGQGHHKVKAAIRQKEMGMDAGKWEFGGEEGKLLK